MRKHFVDGSVAHPRERLTLVALVSALVLGLLVAMAAYRPAMAVERTTLTCHDAVNGDLTCTETTLQELINANAALDAPPPIRIELGAGDTLLTRTLVIPANVDVEFVNYPDQAGVATQSSLVRSGFTGSLISVAGALTMSQNGAGSVAIDGRGGTGVLVSVTGSLTLNAGEITGARNIGGNNGAVTVSGATASFAMNGGEIHDNVRDANAQNGAGGVLVDNGATFTLSGGSVRANEGGTYYDGGGVAARNGSHVVIEGGTISENVGFWGAGVLVDGVHDHAGLIPVKLTATYERVAPPPPPAPVDPAPADPAPADPAPADPVPAQPSATRPGLPTTGVWK